MVEPRPASRRDGSRGQVEEQMSSTAERRKYTEAEEEFFRAFGRVKLVGIGLMIERWESRRLTTGQLRLLTGLRDASNPLALSELSRLLHVGPATITRMTRSLVRRRLI